MHTIEVDDEVFGRLQARARPFLDTPNDVIKRLLGGAEATPAAAAGPVANHEGAVDVAPGRLRGLIESGLVQAGDTVRHHRKRTNEVFEATITAGGCLKVHGVDTSFREPSPALRHFTGSQIDGWHNWVHVSTGRTLRDLRNNGRAGSQ